MFALAIHRRGLGHSTSDRTTRQTVAVAFDIFLQAFLDGGAAEADVEVILSVVDPYIRRRDESCVHLETSDGGADVYGLETSVQSLLINHASGRAIWDLIYELAQSAGLAVMPVGCPTCVTDKNAFNELPPELAASAIVVSSADDLRLVVSGVNREQRSVGVASVEQDGSDE